MSVAVPVPIMLGVTVTPSGMLRKVTTSESASLSALAKPSTNLMVATCHGHVRWGLTLQAGYAAVTVMSSPVVTSASLIGLCLITTPLTRTSAVTSSPSPSAEALAMIPLIVTVSPVIPPLGKVIPPGSLPLVGIVHVIVVPPSESTSLPSPT